MVVVLIGSGRSQSREKSEAQRGLAGPPVSAMVSVPPRSSLLCWAGYHGWAGLPARGVTCGRLHPHLPRVALALFVSPAPPGGHLRANAAALRGGG